jgi:hypothetical protein
MSLVDKVNNDGFTGCRLHHHSCTPVRPERVGLRRVEARHRPIAVDAMSTCLSSLERHFNCPKWT